MLFVLFFVTCQVAFCLPLRKTDNIQSLVLPPIDSSFFIQSSSRQDDTIKPTTSEAAGISRSQLGYIRISRVGSRVTLPRIAGVSFTVHLKGSINHKGFKSENVDSFIRERAGKYSSELREYLSEEKRSMQARAGGRYFWFFQAGANYGYSKTDRTQEVLKSSDFLELSNDTKKVLNQTETTDLAVSHDTNFSGTTTTTSGGTIEASSYILVNRITLDSGRIFDVIQDSPELVVADNNGDVLGTSPPGSVSVDSEGGNINDNLLDTVLDRNRKNH